MGRIYSICSKSANPLIDTSYNFVRTVPYVILLMLASCYSQMQVSMKGILLAIISVSITSGMGYAIWYFVVKRLTSVQVAVIQLLVPIIAAFDGILWLSETLTTRLIIASAITLTWILLVSTAKKLAKPAR